MNKVNLILFKINLIICVLMYVWLIKIKMLNWILDKFWIYELNFKFFENYLWKYYDILKMKIIEILKRFYL